jgi:archaeosortase A (PGF-CTERM-specific)
VDENIMDKEKTTLIFIILPLVFVIVGILFYPYEPQDEIITYLTYINFTGLVLLAIGYFIKLNGKGHILKIIGWSLVAFFWSTQINSLYFGEDGDIVNAFFCCAGIFVLFYIAYHEWLSIEKKESVSCLNWIAGAAAIAGFIYFGIELTPLQMWLRETVASQSAYTLEIFVDNVEIDGIFISWQTATINLIFACTAVQSMVLFVGIILPLPKVDIKYKLIGLAVTVLPVYFLNLVRNALVVFLTGNYGDDFFPIAHNVIAKILSLIALVILLFILIKILPQVFDEISCIIDLPKRKGPIERFMYKIIGSKK